MGSVTFGEGWTGVLAAAVLLVACAVVLLEMLRRGSWCKIEQREDRKGERGR